MGPSVLNRDSDFPHIFLKAEEEVWYKTGLGLYVQLMRV